MSQRQLEEKEKLELFYKSQIEKIQLLQETYDCIYFAIGDATDYPFSYINEAGEVSGSYSDIFTYFKDALKIDFEMVEFADYQLALGELEENNIQILTGMLIASEEQPRILEEELLFDSKNITFSDPITNNKIILVGRSDDIAFTTKTILNYYWGIEERYLPIVKDTDFDGHTIEYNSSNDLIQAVNGDELQGMLIKESSYNYYVDNLLKNSDNYVLEYSYPVEERFTYNAENVILNQLLDNLLNMYLETYDVTSSDFMAADVFKEDDTSKKHVIAITTYVLGLAATVLIIFSVFNNIKTHRTRKKRIRDLENRLTIKPDVDYEKFYIDLKQGRIISNKHFSSMLRKRKRKSLRLNELSELTGYDYELHYKNIVFLGEENFSEEYALYVDGEKRHFLENGVYDNGFLVTVLTKAY